MRLAAIATLGLLSACHLARPVAVADGKPFAPDPARIHDASAWRVLNGDASAIAADGKRVVRLAPKGGNRKGSNVAMALVESLQLSEGTIEVDLNGNGREQASFLGVAFDVAGADAYEAVYFRPFNFQADDAVHRGHAVQYVAWPEHTWERLRAQTPGKYEAPVDPVPDPARWFHARIEVARTKVSVFVDDGKAPCLVVDRLAGPGSGGIGLWVDSQEGAFANLTIVPAR